MKNVKKKSILSTELCRAALSMSMASISNNHCTFIFYEPKQPKQLEQIDIKQLKKSIINSK